MHCRSDGTFLPKSDRRPRIVTRSGTVEEADFIRLALGLEFDIDADDMHDEDFESEESAPVTLLASRII